MRNFEIIIYSKPDGTKPVVEFLNALPLKMHVKAVKEIELLGEYGNELREPYTKCLGDGVFELRIKAGNDISRILYFFYDGRRIVLTNGFIKKTWKTPKMEIKRAKNYRKEYMTRCKEE